MPKPAGRAVFLDRDGVIIREVDYLGHPERLRLLAGAPEGIRRLRGAGFKVIVVSNQSGVARGYFTLAALRRITARMIRELAVRGARLDAVYYCVHRPEAGGRVACRCRKPGTLLLERAARRFGLDLARSYFVGDATIDIQTARNAGCAAVLVATGKGGRDGRYAAAPDRRARDLRAAAAWIVGRAPIGGSPARRRRPRRARGRAR